MSELHNHKGDFEKSLQQAFEGYSPKADEVVWDSVREHTSGFEQKVQQAFAGYTLKADGFVWENILNALRDKNRRRFVWWQWAGAAVIAGLLLFTVFRYNEYREPQLVNNTDESTQLAFDSKKAATPPIKNEKKSTTSALGDEADKPFNKSDEVLTIGLASNSNLTSNAKNASNESLEQKNVLVIDEKQTNDINKMRLLQSVVCPVVPEGLLAEEGVTDYLLPKYTLPKETEEQKEEDISQLAMAANFASSSSAQIGSYKLAQEASFDQASTQSFASYSDRTDHPAITIGATFVKPLSKRWEIESGLSYSLLSSTIISEISNEQTTTRSNLHYLGIPAIMNFKIVNKKRFTIYSSQGLLIEKGLINASKSTSIENGLVVQEQNSSFYMPGWQIGTLAGVGVDYLMGKRISIYAQPSASLWFLNINHFGNSRNSSLLTPNLRAGVRVGL